MMHKINCLIICYSIFGYLQAFQELQTKMITTTQQIKVSDAQIEQLKRSIKHSELVEHEIVALPESTRLYEGVGRM